MIGSNVLTVLAIVVSAVTALTIAHLHRKQMRQIELYKKDSSVGLIPPPSKLTYFVKSKADTILGIGLPAISLIRVLTYEQPLTRWDAFIISLNVAMIFVYVIMKVFLKVMDRTLDMLRSLTRVQEEHLSLTGRLVDQVGKDETFNG
jgi:hypothetical protein